MKNTTMLIAFLTFSFLGSQQYYGSTTAPVVLAGGIIKKQHLEDQQQKYKRKDCPVCKGKGWYMSGDGIKKIDCQYCEPETQQFKLLHKNDRK